MLTALRQRFRRWLFRPQIDTGTVTLVQRRIFIVPSKQGFALAGVLVLMLLGDINYALSLGYVLTFLLAMVAVLSMLYTFRNLAQLQIRAGRADAVFCGEDAEFVLHFQNLGKVVRYQLELRDAEQHSLVFDLPPEQESALAFAIPTQQRGWLACGRLTLSTRFPLGLFYAWSYLHFDTRCLVYPRPVAVAELPNNLAPDQTGKKQGVGEEEFAGLRTYQPGDPLTRIAWKAWARERGLQVKQLSSPWGETVWLDFALTPARNVEDKLSYLTRWVLDADQQGLRYGLRLPGHEVAVGQGATHRAECLSYLALYQGGAT